MWRRAALAIAVVALVAVGASEEAWAARAEPIGRFVAPVQVTAAPGDTRRLFVVERFGRIRVLNRGRLMSRPFVDLRRSVEMRNRRRIDRDQGGLLSMAFSPRYRRDRRLYVVYTRRDGMIHIDELRRSRRDPGRVARGSRRTVLAIPRESSNDLGGGLEFGPDRQLYVGLGYGADPESSGDLSTLTGKLLRIDPRPRGRSAYRVPRDNPFVGRAGARPEIYAYGLRVPWRFSFDSASGDLLMADVGERSFEEVTRVPLRLATGAHFGWPLFEGRRRRQSGQPRRLLFPQLVRSHRAGACAIIGGHIVRDRGPRSLSGRYLYADLCTGEVRSVRLTRRRASGDRWEGIRVGYPVSFGQDARGRVYLVSLEGPVYRIL